MLLDWTENNLEKRTWRCFMRHSLCGCRPEQCSSVLIVVKTFSVGLF